MPSVLTVVACSFSSPSPHFPKPAPGLTLPLRLTKSTPAPVLRHQGSYLNVSRH